MPARTSSRSGSLWRTSRYDGVQDRGARPVVPPQHDDLRVPVPLPELEDVADRRAAELVDRLVVVTDHRDVAMPLGDQRDELRLGPVRVLELVHQHVPEPRLDRLAGRRRLPQQPQRERDLVPEVDRAVRGQQRLVARVGAGQLALPARLLLQRRGGVPLRRRFRASPASARRRRCGGAPLPPGGPRGRGTPRATRPRPWPARTAWPARPGTSSGPPAAGTRPARARTGAPAGTRRSPDATAPGRPSAAPARARTPGRAGPRRRGTCEMAVSV